MVDATFLKKISAVSVAAVLLGFGAAPAFAQTTTDPLARVNQDELASFYGRMNAVVGSGARAFGMGGAFLARADDATAASWNPAGLSYLRRTEFSLVGVHNDFLQKVPREIDVETQNVASKQIQITHDQLRGSVADFAGFVYPLRFKGRTGAVQASYQRSFSFSGTRTGQATQGGNTEFTVEGSGGFDSLSLSSGFEISPQLRLGLSINRWINGFSQSVRRRDSGGASRQIDSSWDISGTNFNFGALLTPTPKLNLGAVLKTPFAATVHLSKSRVDTAPEATGVDLPSGTVTNLDSDTNQSAGDVRIRFPKVYGFGASYRATNTVTLSVDFTRTEWSQASIAGFFSLAKKDPASKTDPLGIDRYGTLPFPAVEEQANGQINTSQLRLGAEWVLRLGHSGELLLPLRTGFFRDGQPFVAPLSNGAGFPPTRIEPVFSGVTAGLGVTIGGALFDVAYIRETGEVPVDLPGGLPRRVTYNRLFASMILRFGPRR